MPSMGKRCRHSRDEQETCGCKYYIRYQKDRKTFYVPLCADKSEAERTFALWRNPPPALREVTRAPGLVLPPQQKQPWIYFLAGAHLVKVGWTGDLRKRIGAIQADSPVPLTLMLVLEGGAEVERRIHARYDAYRRHGEWFALPVGWENDPGLLEMAKPRHLEVAA
jgi:hypothetical protein